MRFFPLFFRFWFHLNLASDMFKWDILKKSLTLTANVPARLFPVLFLWSCSIWAVTYSIGLCHFVRFLSQVVGMSTKNIIFFLIEGVLGPQTYLVKVDGRGQKLGVHTFPDPFGHFGDPSSHFWFCRLCVIAGGERVPPGATRLVLSYGSARPPSFLFGTCH